MANFNQLSNVFTSQPSFPVKHDNSWINPKHLWLLTPFPIDVVGGAHCILQGQSSTLSTGSLGNCVLGVTSDNTSPSGFASLPGATNCGGLSELTMFGVVEFSSLAAGGEVCILRCDQNYNTSVASYALDVFPNTKTVRPLIATSISSGWVTGNDIVRNEIAVNIPLVFIARWSNDTGLRFLDVCVSHIGDQITWSHAGTSNCTGSIIATGGGSTANCNMHIGGSAYNGTVNFPGKVYLAGILPYYITNNDAQRLVNNPWSVFKYPDEFAPWTGIRKTFLPSHNIQFYSQPQYPAKPASSSSFNLGLTGLIHFPNGNSVEAISKSMMADTIINGSITKGISATNSAVGPCSVKYYNGANSTRIEKPLLGNGDVTVLAIANPAASSTDTGTMFRQSGSAGQIWFSGHSDEFEATNISGQVVLGLNQTSVNRSALKAASASDGNWHVFVATKSGGTGVIYRDGTALSTTVVGTLTGAPATTTDSSQVGGDSTSATYTLGGSGVALVATWNRALTKNEIYDISQDPWKLFELPDDSSAYAVYPVPSKLLPSVENSLSSQPQYVSSFDKATGFSPRIIDAVMGRAAYSMRGQPYTFYNNVGSAAYSKGYGYKGNGSNSGLSFPCDLSQCDAITIVFEYTQFSVSGIQSLVEHSANHNSNTGTFNLYTDASTNRLYFRTYSGGYDSAYISLPTLGVTNTVAIRARMTSATGTADLGLALNGAVQTLTSAGTSAIAMNFANYNTYLLCRGGTTFGADAILGGYIIMSGFATDDELAKMSQSLWSVLKAPHHPVFSYSALPTSGSGSGSNIFSVSAVESGSSSDAVSAIGTFRVSLTESGSSSDAVSAIGTFRVSLTESGTGTDTTSYISNFSDTVAETGTGIDTQTGANTTASSLTETGTGSEVVSSIATFVSAIVESGSGVEVSSYTTTYSGTVGETGTGSEAVTSQAAFTSSSFESGTGSETVTGQAVFGATRADTGSAVDTSSTTYTYVSTQTETGSSTDSASSLATFAGTVSEAGTGSETASVQAAFVSTQTETGSAVDLSTFGGITLATQTESGSSADTQSALGVFVSAQTETGAGSDATSVLAVFAGSVTESGSSSDSASTGSATTSSQAETGSATDTNTSQATFLAARVEAGSAAEAATSLVNFVSTQTETGSAAETPVGVATMSVSTSDSGAASDVASTGSQTSASNAETLSSADSAIGVSNLFASSTDSGSALDVASGVGIMTGTLSEAGSLSEALVEQFTFYVNISEVRSAADSVSGLVNLFASVGESGSATDLSRLGTTILTSMAESATFSDVFSYAYIKTKIVDVIDPFVVYRTSASSSIVVRRPSGGYPTIRIRNR